MCRRRLPLSQPTAAPLDDDDLLSEILLRLPPLPSSLPRASAVCKRWHSLASDLAFCRRFRRHHRRNPPLLGFFHRIAHRLSFKPTLESPNRVPPERFSLELGYLFQILGCRHGLVLILEEKPLKFLVWDPVTGQHYHLVIPPWFDPTKAVYGTVLRSAAGDVPYFKVVLVAADKQGELNRRWLACVYSSETGVWGNLISTPNPSQDFIFVSRMLPPVLVGGSLYWHLLPRTLGSILEFNVETESLSVIPMPTSHDLHNFTVMPAEGGGLGFLSVSGFTVQLWKRNTDSHGVPSWEMGTAIELGKLLSLNSDSDDYLVVLGFAEGSNSVYLMTAVSMFTVQLGSLQFKKRSKLRMVHYGHPFESVYAAGI